MPQNTPVAPVCPITLNKYSNKEKYYVSLFWTDVIMQNHLLHSNIPAFTNR